MTAALALHVAVHCVVPPGMSSRCMASRTRACRARAFAPHFTRHFARHSALLSDVPLIAPQAADSLHLACPCLRAVRRAAFGAAVQRAGVLPRTCRACGPGRVCRGAGCSRSSATGPQRPGADAGGHAEGKTKGRGTGPRRKPVCTWGWRSTERLRRRAACGAKPAPRQGGPRASHAGARPSFQGAKP